MFSTDRGMIPADNYGTQLKILRLKDLIVCMVKGMTINAELGYILCPTISPKHFFKKPMK